MIDGQQRLSMVLENGQNTRSVAAMFAVSAVCHAGFFLLMAFMPTSFSSSSFRRAPGAISVDLVSLPAAEPAPAVPAATVAPPPEVEQVSPPPEAVPISAPKPDAVPIKPKPKPKKVVKALKKKTYKKDKVKKAVVQKPAPPAAKPSQTKVQSAIESMRRKVADQEKARTAAGTGGTGTGTGGGGGGAAVLSRIQNYRIEAAIAVSQNWAFSQQLAGADDQLETRITFRILPNGDITEIKIVQPSGNRYLDESAFRAVRKASPVAPHPEGVNRPYVEVGVKATPSGFR